MAKFAVALCILLVACGAQGYFGSAPEFISSVIDQSNQKIDEALVNLVDRWKAAVASGEEFSANFAASTEEALERIRLRREEAASNAQDLSVCVSEAADNDAAFDKMKSNVDACVSAIQSELQTSVDETEEELAAFRSVIAEFQAKANECPRKRLYDIPPCVRKVASEIESGVVNVRSSPFDKVATVLQEIANNNNTLATCLSTAAYTDLEKQAKATYAAVNECLANVVEEP